MSEEAPASGTHGSTLFVSNLPYTVTSVDLQTLFSDIGPVRSAFVVQDKETKASKGVGYVSFAIKEDAQRAFEQNDLQLDSRKLRVQWPSQKIKDEDATPKPKRQPRAPPPEKVAESPVKPSEQDGLAIRTIVISGLPRSVDNKALWKKIRKEDGAEEVKFPVEGAPADVAHATFATPKHAFNAAKHLHAHVFKSSLLSVSVKKRLDIVHSKKRGAPGRNSRLIVRNLPFNVTEDDLRTTFLPFGPIYSINIPQTVPVTKAEGSDDEAPGPSTSQPRGKGFAFIWFVTKPDAEKAITGANGKPLRLAEDTASIAAAGTTKKVIKRKGKEKEARVIAVDWALSKSKWEEEKAKLEDAMEVDEQELASDSEAEDGDESKPLPEGDGEGEEEEEALGVHDGHDSSGSDQDDDDAMEEDRSDAEDEPKVRPQLPATDVGTTLFIRNVPYDASEDDLRELFRAFGPLRYARITIDKETGRSRGTGFACFWKKEDADAVIEHSNLLRDSVGDMNAPATGRKNPFSMPSILTPDPSSSLARSLVLHGRTLDVTRAVTRDEAGKLKEQGERKREKADKRNLYLMREGVIFPNSPAAGSLSTSELEKRMTSYNARRTLLRSNPSLYVSKTRLSVRQLPLWASERVLKRLATHAVRVFESEVKSGSRQPLADDELHPPEDEEEGEKEKEPEQKKRRRPGERPTVVTQAKIVRVSDRLDAVTGKGRSRGYGFLQMTTHADALRVLRWANNNPVVEGLMRGWFKAELEDLLKGKGAAGVKKEDGALETPETDKARKNRIKSRIEEFAGKEDEGKESKSKTSGLILEFSIENVQVVKKRREKQDVQTTGEQQQGTKRTFMDSVTRTDDSPRDKKRRKTEKTDKKRDSSKPRKSAAPSEAANEDNKPSETAPTSPDKTSKNNLGGLIGRKRKERKARRG